MTERSTLITLSKTIKQPDWTGKGYIDKNLLKALVEKVKGGEEAEMRVALWDRTF